jgi:hypothetical protein
METATCFLYILKELVEWFILLFCNLGIYRGPRPLHDTRRRILPTAPSWSLLLLDKQNIHLFDAGEQRNLNPLWRDGHSRPNSTSDDLSWL